MEEIIKEKISLRLSQLNNEILIKKGEVIDSVSYTNFMIFIDTSCPDNYLFSSIEPSLSLTKNNEIVAVWDIGSAKISINFLKTGDVVCLLISDCANFQVIYPVEKINAMKLKEVL